MQEPLARWPLRPPPSWTRDWLWFWETGSVPWIVSLCSCGQCPLIRPQMQLVPPPGLRMWAGVSTWVALSQGLCLSAPTWQCSWARVGAGKCVVISVNSSVNALLGVGGPQPCPPMLSFTLCSSEVLSGEGLGARQTPCLLCRRPRLPACPSLTPV